jgi:hypothetical protein
VYQSTFNNPFNAATVAHEMGHNFGISHDNQGGTNTQCPSSGFIMASVGGSSNPADTFSSCSAQNLEAWWTPNKAACLENVPSGPCVSLIDANDPFHTEHAWDCEPLCGNGLLEPGEQCDCGSDDCSGIDPCCNGATCSFVSGATCSSLDGCCDPSTCAVRNAVSLLSHPSHTHTHAALYY